MMVRYGHYKMVGSRDEISNYKMTGHFLVKNSISYKMSFYKAPNPTHFIREIQRGMLEVIFWGVSDARFFDFAVLLLACF